MQKKFIFIVIGLLIASAGFAAWWFLSEEEIPPPSEVRVTIPFLKHQSDWVDTLMKNMSREEKIGQLFVVSTPAGFIEHVDSMQAWLKDFHIGGMHVESSYLLDQTLLINQLQDTATIPLMVTAEAPSDAQHWPEQEVILAIRDSALISQYDSVQLLSIEQQGNKLLLPHSLDLPQANQWWHAAHIDSAQWLEQVLNQVKQEHHKNLISSLSYFDAYHDFEFDTLNLRDSILHRYNYFTHKGIPAIHLDPKIQFDNPLKELPKNHLRHYMAEYLEFNGLIISKSFQNQQEENPIAQALYAGVDLIVLEDSHIREKLNFAKTWIEDGGLSDADLDDRVRKILLAKSWSGIEIFENINYPLAEENWKGKQRQALIRRMHEASITLLNNQNKLLPLKEIRNDSLFTVIEIGTQPKKELLANLKYYSPYRYKKLKTKPDEAISPLKAAKYKRYNPIILHFNNLAIDAERDSVFLRSLAQLAESKQVIIVNQLQVQNLTLIPPTIPSLQIYGSHPDNADYALQTVFGGVAVNGWLPANISDSLRYHSGEVWEKAGRLSYGMPEEVGLDSDTLKRIQYIANSVISKKATPGCQVLVAKNGKVVYQKTFGFHTYDKKKRVKWNDIYDLASVTKVAATTIGAMKRYEEGKFSLQDSLKNYLPDSISTSTIKNITWHEILIHRTGLSSGQKILRFLRYQNDSVGRFDKYFCDYSDNYFDVTVAENFYLNNAYVDSIWLDINHMWIDKAKPYKYSDANFNLLYFLLESFLPANDFFDKWLDREFYAPLGLQNTCYKPLKRFGTGRIVPTEDEKYWRKQLLRGHVHDPTAALMGGVAGNAGLFSNANDMSILFQMLLNDGSYGGKQYLKPSTVQQFTRHANNSHRGLGFNKPSGTRGVCAPDAPTSSFGHTGFTGICVWVDPEEELVYLFLSNRVHPNSTNKKLVQNGTRKNIHQTIYDAIIRPSEPVDTLAPIPTDTFLDSTAIAEPIL